MQNPKRPMGSRKGLTPNKFNKIRQSLIKTLEIQRTSNKADFKKGSKGSKIEDNHKIIGETFYWFIHILSNFAPLLP